MWDSLKLMLKRQKAHLALVGLKVLPRSINRLGTNHQSNITHPRPNPYSLKSDGTILSWENLNDKSFFARHAPPVNQPLSAPDINAVVDLFCRDKKDFQPGRANIFFMMFAQWFTDGFFRSNHYDSRKTDSNHQIDLCQIYGINEDVTKLLRSHERGKLLAEEVNGEELPPLLYEKTKSGEYQVKKCFRKLPYVEQKYRSEENGEPTNLDHLSRLEGILLGPVRIQRKDKSLTELPDDVKSRIRVTGIDRGTSTVGHKLINTLFFREHNRICEELIAEGEFDASDDENLFQTARAVNTLILLRLTVEHYINNMGGLDTFQLDLDRPKSKKEKLNWVDRTFGSRLSWFERKYWYREPWIAAEFNLLYRWHGLVPGFDFDVSGTDLPFTEQAGLYEGLEFEDILKAASELPAGKIQMGNTPSFLKAVELETIKKGRDWKLPTYNQYRVMFGFKPFTSFEELSTNKELTNELKSLYGDIDNLEFTAGIFAEEPNGKFLAGSLLTSMVAYDAFTQIYTNPLLANRNYHHVLSEKAKQIVENTNTLEEFVNRNTRLQVKSLTFEAKPVLYEVGHRLKPEHFNKILCPNLRIGVRLGLLNPDENGWVTEHELTHFLNRIGVSDLSWLSAVLVSGGVAASKEKASTDNYRNGYVNIVNFENTFLDHGSSTCILNNEDGFDKDRLDVILQFSSSGRFYMEQFKKIAEFCHEQPVKKKAQAKGEKLQLLEFEIILKIYGRKDKNNRLYLREDDLVDIWQNSTPPQDWDFAAVNKTPTFPWSVKTIIINFFRVLLRKHG